MNRDEALGHYAQGLLHGVLIVVTAGAIGLLVEWWTR